MRFFQQLKEFFSRTDNRDSNGQWELLGDVPVFIHGGEPINTIVIFPEKKAEETVDTDQKKLDS